MTRYTTTSEPTGSEQPSLSDLSEEADTVDYASMTIEILQKELKQCQQDRRREHDLYCKLAAELKNITEVLADIKECIQYVPRYLPERKVEGSRSHASYHKHNQQSNSNSYDL